MLTQLAEVQQEAGDAASAALDRRVEFKVVNC